MPLTSRASAVRSILSIRSQKGEFTGIDHGCNYHIFFLNFFVFSTHQFLIQPIDCHGSVGDFFAIILPVQNGFEFNFGSFQLRLSQFRHGS